MAASRRRIERLRNRASLRERGCEIWEKASDDWDGDELSETNSGPELDSPGAIAVPGPGLQQRQTEALEHDLETGSPHVGAVASTMDTMSTLTPETPQVPPPGADTVVQAELAPTFDEALAEVVEGERRKREMAVKEALARERLEQEARMVPASLVQTVKTDGKGSLTEANGECPACQKSKYYWAGICGVLTVVLVVVLAIVVSNKENTDTQPTQKSSFSPTESPIFLVPSSSPSLGDIQVDVLEKFFLSLRGTQWKENGGWLIDDSVCIWHGIVCDGEGEVAEIDLDDNGLVGSLPTELGLLTKLSILDLWTANQDRRNTLTGSIPTEIGLLENLKYVRLGGEPGINGGNFSSPIPSEIGLLTSLTVLSLASLSIPGKIPPEFGSLGKLTSLDLRSNALTGSIPSDLGLSLIALDMFGLDGNLLTGNLTASLCRPSTREWIILRADCTLDTLECSCCTACTP